MRTAVRTCWTRRWGWRPVGGSADAGGEAGAGVAVCGEELRAGGGVIRRVEGVPVTVKPDEALQHGRSVGRSRRWRRRLIMKCTDMRWTVDSENPVIWVRYA